MHVKETTKIKIQRNTISHWLFPVMFETQGSIYFVETTKIGANE